MERNGKRKEMDQENEKTWKCRGKVQERVKGDVEMEKYNAKERELTF